MTREIQNNARQSLYVDKKLVKIELPVVSEGSQINQNPNAAKDVDLFTPQVGLPTLVNNLRSPEVKLDLHDPEET